MARCETIDFPRRHETNDDPTCSFAVTTRNGSRGMAREVRSMCARVYTGTCTSRCEWPRSDRQADTSLLVHGRNWTLSFEDWHALNPEKVFPNDTNAPLVAGQFLFKNQSRVPDAVFLTLGVWEAFTLNAYREGRLFSPYRESGGNARQEYTAHIKRSLEFARPLRDLLAARGSMLVIVSTPQCLRQQQTYWRQVFGRSGGWPTLAFEELVGLGNQLSEEWARDSRRSRLPVFFLDAAKVVHAAPRMIHSPCFEHHPHGVLSDIIVSIAKTAIGLPLGKGSCVGSRRAFTSRNRTLRV
jgi:hypothetical protein